MNKLVCFFHTETNGLHIDDSKISKKLLYNFARLVALFYEIGYYENKKFISIIKTSMIVKPRSMYINNSSFHNITQEYAVKNGSEIVKVIETFINDIKKVEILISHNIDFHIKTILAECIRYNIVVNLTPYIFVDIMTFNKTDKFIKLQALYESLFKKSNAAEENNSSSGSSILDSDTIDKLSKIRLVFTKLYFRYKKHIKNNI